MWLYQAVYKATTNNLFQMPRRSLVLPQDGPPEGETVDTTVERRMRRSIVRSSLAPNDLRRSVLVDNAQRTNSGASGTPSSAPPVSPQVFFNCLKLAAENLAGCSLDAGTKIYAARVDHVAGGMAEFAMSMSMMHKKAQAKAAEGDEGDMEMGDNDDEQGAAKKKKKKELMMDMSKTIPKNKMFSIVGNLMDEAIDSASFSFCDRSNVGSVKDMTPAQLEEEKGDFLPANTVLPTLSEECDLCPSLSNFKFGTIENSLDWSHLASNRTSRRNTRVPQATDSPRLTLSQQNLDPGLDEAAAQPFDEPDDFQNFTMGGGTIIEEVAACGAARRLEAVADNDDNFEFSVRLPESSFAFSFQINENELRPLHGPFFWKYKRPTLRNRDGSNNQDGSQKPLMPSDDEDDVELGQEALDDDDELNDAEAMQNLFQLLNDSNVVATMAPVWKTMRGINMRLMEALLWKQIDAPEHSEQEKLSGRWKLHNLREGLPKKTQNSASVTTTLYALLNLANKKGLVLQANSVLSSVTVQRLNGKQDKSRRSRVHPALLSN
ncbi:hypothetical protein B566_EDAN011561 [Ephemera danica]|nr:hypothetical protein B566_EDAN011561 [Ephemera danica]